MDEDSFLGGKSDPLCVLRLGAQKFQTEKIDSTINPKWNSYCEVCESGRFYYFLNF